MHEDAFNRYSAMHAETLRSVPASLTSDEFVEKFLSILKVEREAIPLYPCHVAMLVCIGVLLIHAYIGVIASYTCNNRENNLYLSASFDPCMHVLIAQIRAEL